MLNGNFNQTISVDFYNLVPFLSTKMIESLHANAITMDFEQLHKFARFYQDKQIALDYADMQSQHVLHEHWKEQFALKVKELKDTNQLFVLDWFLDDRESVAETEEEEIVAKVCLVFQILPGNNILQQDLMYPLEQHKLYCGEIGIQVDKQMNSYFSDVNLV